MSQTILAPMTDFRPGEQIIHNGRLRGSFIEYGRPEWACPATHISHPNMRIVVYDLHTGQGVRGGRTTAWECDVRSAA